MKRILSLILAFGLFLSTLPIYAASIDTSTLISQVKEETIQDTSILTVSKDKSPKYTILYLHGGAYAYSLGSLHLAYADRLAQELDAQVILPDYKVIGQGTWKDAYQLLSILYSKIRSKTKKNIILLGDSAGGGLAAGFYEYLAKQKKKLPNKTILFSPWLDITCSNEEISSYASRDTHLNAESLIQYGLQWADGLDPKDYKLSPLFGDRSKFKNLYLFVGTEEIFYPDITEFYASIRQQKNIQLEIGQGCMHNYPLYIDELEVSQEAFNKVLDFIKT